MTGQRPKLIEVALPLGAINEAAAREKSIRHGHPSTLHLWWARRPLAATRAVIWASLVDDPSGDESLTPEEQEAERQRLFGILERLVVWENSNNPDVLAEARAEIDRCFPDGPPPILDPFAGGGAIPLEAQRFGLKALAGDLNPVAVLINKAMIEIPPRFAGLPPVHPDIDTGLNTWERAQGLAADVEAYGQWMRDEAERRIGHLYPDATGLNGEKLTPIAWIWARTVESPDPSWSGHVPLVVSWTLAKRPGKPKVWIEPIIDRDSQTISYEIREGGEPTHERTVVRGNGTCLATGSAIPAEYVKAESCAGRMDEQLIAVAAEGERGRHYLAPDLTDIEAAIVAQPDWRPEVALPVKGLGFRVQAYGVDQWWKLFTARQLTALVAFSDLLGDVKERIHADAVASGLADDAVRLADGGRGATAYSDAVVTYLAFVVDKCADYWSSICTWNNPGEKMRNTFGRQALPMSWDFAECNPFSSSSGNWMAMVDWVVKAVAHIPAAVRTGRANQRDAKARVRECSGAVLSTDPPYYDNVGYADISDFFFVWLRRNLAEVWSNECSTVLTPKREEIIADPSRHGSSEAAKCHFESRMAEFMAQVAESQPANVPATIYYAYKATESKDGEIRATGWDTFLQAVLDAGLQVNATWPIRTEMPGRMRANLSNALASSIVLACRPRAVSASLATRGEFMAALRDELPEAVRLLQSGNIAPVDMAQSTIGPGIKVFSRYVRVVEADGSSMSVSVALRIINDVLGEILDGEEAELDADTRFALTWFTEHGYEPGPSGDADSVARAKNTSLAGIGESGVGEAREGKFRLFERTELNPDWSPVDDQRLTVWEVLQYLVAALDRSESEAAELLHTLGGIGDRARQLAYLLYQKANDKGWASEAGAYNRLIGAWPNLQAHVPSTTAQQQLL
ncbi:MAG: DUF1156 domain-containing protein [Acidimicrobiaceae bacterium]|nr:DUF1156 domain-containing protein [Acidimicrobiaceae bacterium]MYG54759.1 DUF1156 domain-containing protein [Acidimicrobiaceae bacterium]MYJ98832.1 DUF1156 domain-containing protein [Acidimicrobiaceae bacterium]